MTAAHDARIRTLTDRQLAFGLLDCRDRLRLDALTDGQRRELRHVLAVVLWERRRRRRRGLKGDRDGLT